MQFCGCGKLRDQSLSAAQSIGHSTSCRLFITCKNTKKQRKNQQVAQLYAANGSTKNTYGEKLKTLNLGLRRNFKWIFNIADVAKPIIGADFLRNFGLTVDLQRRKLRDQTTNLESIGKIKNSFDIFNFNSKLIFHDLLEEF